MWLQREIQLKARSRGCHLITKEIERNLSELSEFKRGLCHLLLLHTSAGLTLNENADPSVRADLERHLNVLAPENASHYTHTMEGADDMPAHIKSSLTGVELTLPVQNGRFRLGTWQGIYLCEYRDHGGARNIVATLQGE